MPSVEHILVKFTQVMDIPYKGVTYEKKKTFFFKFCLHVRDASNSTVGLRRTVHGNKSSKRKTYPYGSHNMLATQIVNNIIIS